MRVRSSQEDSEVTPWWQPSETTPSTSPCWWAIEHQGHPAFYLRSLMPGDFGPFGLGPLARHTYDLLGIQVEVFPVPCFTCGASPLDATRLVPIERVTGLRGRELFFAKYVFGLQPWPGPTDMSTCWNCCSLESPADKVIHGRRVCTLCYLAIQRTMKVEEKEIER